MVLGVALLAPIQVLESADGAWPPGRKRVLIVSPHFPPINAADHYRVRTALPYFAENGWKAEMLAVHPEDVEGVRDAELVRSLPQDTIVHWVRAFPLRWTRKVGSGNLAWRAYRPMRRRADQLLATGRFDLVFFSTTQFGVLPLGPYWQRRHGVPYVLDFQDEWIGRYYDSHPEVVPPGGRLKYALSQWMARQLEPKVMLHAAQIVSVSGHYNSNLCVRHPGLAPNIFHELPFGGEAQDFEQVQRSRVRQDLFDPQDGRRHWVYAGRGGEDMRLAASSFFAALRRALDEGLLPGDSLRVHFLGTSYAPGKLARKSFAPLAEEFGLGEIVSESPCRMPYFTALRCLKDASAILAFGSDEASYMASKLVPALLARRPLLAIFQQESPAVALLRRARTDVVAFHSGERIEKLSQRIFWEWFVLKRFDRKPELDEDVLTAHGARAMTRRLCEIFNAALLGAATSR